MPPFKSEAQRRKFHELVAKGEMNPKTLQKWEAETPRDKKLPARTKPSEATVSRKARKSRVIK